MGSEREQMVEKPYAYCCNGDPAACDCVRPDHGTAFYQAVCTIPNCRNRAPADEAFCSKHRTTSLAAQDGLVEALERCAQIVEQWNHRQNEKVDDIKYIVRNALSAIKGDKS